ncbi:glutamate racemase [Leptolyngbya sp. FACHB-261]|uniref:glutamate racemase n=1 Tax=Leptolyngbya sp. FACHB-261 TaxID=2692806 RepID=UPI001685C0F2|nr:glutamate racemase [Leptolyngbya sp. FACHB-261]MBD2100530.1 glutamate racemase [Leptolyngbya sp. FACHB-261]
MQSVIRSSDPPQLSADAPIGLFDSGAGGLTVLREVQRQLPNESVIYLGDTARLPYGNRSAAEIIRFTQEILAWMRLQRVKMVLMACNTSSALALEVVRQEAGLPVLGVILPGARAAVATSSQRGRRIGVIATLATVTSHAYQRAIQEVDAQVQVAEVACPELVPLIEQNRVSDPQTRSVLQAYLQPLLDWGLDTLVYGCTHYPHLAPVLRQLLPTAVELVDPATHLVAAAAQELDLMNLRSSQPAGAPRFYVTGSPTQFARLSVQWLGYQPATERIVLPPVQSQAQSQVQSAVVPSSHGA